MKILMASEDVPQPTMGGLAIHALALARALRTQGHEVDFLCSDQPSPDVAGAEIDFGGSLFPELSGHTRGWGERHLGCFLPPKRTWVARHFARTMLRRAGVYDVVHYHGHFPNVAAFIPEDVNFVQTRHDQGGDCLIHTRFRNGAICRLTDPRECAACSPTRRIPGTAQLSALAVRRYRSEVVSAFRRHKTIFVSEHLLKNFQRIAGPGPWGVVIHNFVEGGLVEAAWREPARPLGLGKRQRVVVFMGKLYPPKGIEPFLECLVPVLPSHCHLVIVGDGSQEAILRDKYRSHNVHFLGWMPRTKALPMLAGADALVVPSVWEEPCATTVLEGLMLGKPTYALAQGGTPELARYARYPGQLSLHADLSALCAAAISDGVMPTASLREEIECTESYAARRVLEVYKAPRNFEAASRRTS